MGPEPPGKKREGESKSDTTRGEIGRKGGEKVKELPAFRRTKGKSGVTRKGRNFSRRRAALRPGGKKKKGGNALAAVF